jgi:cob(I)alamin adenosyltransferase
MYTRRGDKGETSLFGPKRVGKDSPRVEAYGAIDELNSLLGVVIADCKDRKLISELKSIQRMLFVAGGDLAAEGSASARVPRIAPRHTLEVETMTDRALRSLPPLRNFILPGGSRVASELQLARAVCRRAERRVVAASRAESVNQELIPFFNRLSSYLFNASRTANAKARRKEEAWSAEG